MLYDVCTSSNFLARDLLGTRAFLDQNAGEGAQNAPTLSWHLTKRPMVSELVRIETECSARTSSSKLQALSVPFFAFPRQPNRKQARLSPTGQEDTLVRDDCPQLVTLTASTQPVNTPLVNHISDFSSTLSHTYSPLVTHPFVRSHRSPPVVNVAPDPFNRLHLCGDEEGTVANHN